MGSYNAKNKKTGAKKVIVTTSLVLTLFAGLPTVAYADVSADNVIGDLQVSEDRSDVKKNDVNCLVGRYNEFMDLTEIEKAIVLSDILNDYYFDGYYFTNTTPNEMLNVDINKMYDRYLRAQNKGTELDFCSKYINDRPSIDGYITLASKSVVCNIENGLINRVRWMYESQGKNVYGVPKIIVEDNQVLCVINVDGVLRNVVINGDEINNIITVVNYLNNTYNTAINNIGGLSQDNDGTFIYNGIFMYTGESVYYSIGDTNKKTIMTNGINVAREVNDSTKYSISLNSVNGRLTREERNRLRSMGYSTRLVDSARKDIIYLDKVVNKILTK